MIPREVIISVENRSGLDFRFGGEWFEAGGWADGANRPTELGQGSTVLHFSGKTWFRGCSGYTFFHSEDRSRTVLAAFSIPVVGEAMFSARAGQLVSAKDFYEQIPKVSSKMVLSDGCAWELTRRENSLTVVLHVLPENLTELPAELQAQLEHAAPCGSEMWRPWTPPGAELVERRFVVEVENHSPHTFAIDGLLFEAGDWEVGPPVLPAGSMESRLEFASQDMLKGVSGVLWFVDQSTREVYLSICLCNPIAGDASFAAWAGPPPSDLQAELQEGHGPNALQKAKDTFWGCSWNYVGRGATVSVKLALLPELNPITGFIYRDVESEEEVLAESPPAGETDGSGDTLAKSEEGDFRKDMDDLLKSSRPKDALAGIGSGLKMAGMGLASGAATLVASPVIGAQNNGVGGFFSGLATGLVGAVGFSAAGAVVGVAQVARGFANTPEAINKRKLGHIWDAEQGRWVRDTCDLRKELAQVLAEESDDESSDEAEVSVSSTVVDTEYYDRLHVLCTASPGEIKKAYYKEALKTHPDKNKNDPNAHEKFQELSRVYQVLSDPSLRSRYDKCGKSGVEGEAMPTIDPMIFFGLLFGSEQFDKYIGKMYLARQIDRMFKELSKETADGIPKNAICDGTEQTAEEQHAAMQRKDEKMKRTQHRREVKLAGFLRERVDRWVIHRDEVGFMKEMSLEAEELVKASFGTQILRTLGLIYEGCGQRFLSNAAERTLQNMQEGARHAGDRMRLVGSIAKSAVAAKRVADHAMKAREDDPDLEMKTLASLEDSLPIFLQTAWEMSALDVESTGRIVCEKLLKDVSVPWQIRFRRAGALQRLGRIFLDCSQGGSTEVGDAEAVRRQLEEALHKSVQEKRSR